MSGDDRNNRNDRGGDRFNVSCCCGGGTSGISRIGRRVTERYELTDTAVWIMYGVNYTRTVGGEGYPPLTSSNPLRCIPPTPAPAVVVVATSPSSFLRPADSSPLEARNAADDSAKFPREAYREENIVHGDENNDGDH